MSTTKRFVAKNGLDNGSNSITNLGDTGSSMYLLGANALTLTTTGATNITLPTSGTLVSSSNSITINGNSLLGNTDISVSSPIKITIIGDSLSSSNIRRSVHWVDILRDNLSHFGDNVSITTLAIGGSTYYTANTALSYNANTTMVNECINTTPDIVIVMLGLNDVSSGRTQLEIKADALTTYTNLRAGLPTAKILYVSELFYDNTNFTPTTIKNKGIIPTYFNLPSSGILLNSYTSEALETVVSSTVQTKVTNWVALDTYIKGFSQVDAYCTYNHWKSARMGLFVIDGLHQDEEGSKLIAHDILVGLINASFSTTLLPKLKRVPTTVQGTTNSTFTDVLTSSGDGYIPNYSIEHNYYSLESGPFRKYNLDTWFMPFKGNFYVTNTSITNDSFSDNSWILHNTKPNTLIEKSINGGAFSTTGQNTNFSGYANLPIVGKDFGVGSFILRIKVGNEVYGPVTITVSASVGTGTGSAVYATAPTLVTPALGTPTSGNFSTGTFTWPSVINNALSTITNAAGTTLATASANKLKVVGAGGTTVTGSGDTLTITSTTGGGGNITLANLPAGTTTGNAFVWDAPSTSWIIGGNMYSVFNSITPSSGTSVTTSNNIISISGTTPITVTGSGSTLTIAMPVASGSANGYLSSANWTTFNNKGNGTVTSVGVSVPAFLSAGSAVTSSGTIAISYSGSALPVANGGTGVTSSTGTGSNVLSTSPSLTTPTIGTATATRLNLTNANVYCENNTSYFAASGTTGCVLAAAGTTVVAAESTTFRPGTNNSKTLGSASYRWSTVYAVTGTINTSDARLKTDITDSTLGLSFINKLRPVSYKWIEGGTKEVPSTQEELDKARGENRLLEPKVISIPGKRTHYGLLAQEVYEALEGKDFGGYVDDTPSDTKALRYDQFISPLIKAVQELSSMVKDLQEEVLILKSNKGPYVL